MTIKDPIAEKFNTPGKVNTPEHDNMLKESNVLAEKIRSGDWTMGDLSKLVMIRVDLKKTLDMPDMPFVSYNEVQLLSCSRTIKEEAGNQRWGAVDRQKALAIRTIGDIAKGNANSEDVIDGQIGTDSLDGLGLSLEELYTKKVKDLTVSCGKLEGEMDAVADKGSHEYWVAVQKWAVAKVELKQAEGKDLSEVDFLILRCDAHQKDMNGMADENGDDFWLTVQKRAVARIELKQAKEEPLSPEEKVILDLDVERKDKLLQVAPSVVARIQQKKKEGKALSTEEQEILELDVDDKDQLLEVARIGKELVSVGEQEMLDLDVDHKNRLGKELLKLYDTKIATDGSAAEISAAEIATDGSGDTLIDESFETDGSAAEISAAEIATDGSGDTIIDESFETVSFFVSAIPWIFLIAALCCVVVGLARLFYYNRVSLTAKLSSAGKFMAKRE